MYYKNFAKIYDKFMSHCNYDEWTEFVKARIKEFNIIGKNLLDIGCGTGEVLLRLKDEFKCSGIDLSEDMLTIANKKLKNKGVKLFLGDMREFDTGERYDIVISLFDTVNHLTSLEDLNDLFNSVKNSLNEGGIYIFDVVDRKFMDKMFSNGIYADNRKDFAVIWEHFYDEDENIDQIDATYFMKNKNKTFDKFTEFYEKRIFTEKEILDCAKNSSFSIERYDVNDKLAGERFFYVLKNK